MPLNVPAGFYNVALIFQASHGTPEFVTTLGVSGVSGTPTPEDAGNAVFDAYSTTIRPSMDNSVSMVGTRVYVGSSGPSGSIEVPRTPVAGGGNGTYSPIALSFIARKNTSIVGRQGRGRMFLPGVVEEASVDEGGRLAPAALTGWQTILDNFYDALAASLTVAPYLFHTGAVPPSLITSFSIAPIVGILRGRIR